jgi:hypothetical protein
MAQAPDGYPSAFARMQHVLELRRAGRTYQQIADIVGLAKPERAQALVSKAIKRILRETAEEVRGIELSRLDVLINLLWDKVIEDMKAPDPDYQRFDRVKGLIEAKLRWCGAQEIVDNSDKRVTIIISSFVPKNGAAAGGVLVNPMPTLKEIEAMTEPEPSSVSH